jgi:hypothetical protein
MDGDDAGDEQQSGRSGNGARALGKQVLDLTNDTWMLSM